MLCYDVLAIGTKLNGANLVARVEARNLLRGRAEWTRSGLAAKLEIREEDEDYCALTAPTCVHTLGLCASDFEFRSL